MVREGKKRTDLGDGPPRRLSDGRNAARKMSRDQLSTFIPWLIAERPEEVSEILADLGFKR